MTQRQLGRNPGGSSRFLAPARLGLGRSRPRSGALAHPPARVLRLRPALTGGETRGWLDQLLQALHVAVEPLAATHVTLEHAHTLSGLCEGEVPPPRPRRSRRTTSRMSAPSPASLLSGALKVTSSG